MREKSTNASKPRRCQRALQQVAPRHGAMIFSRRRFVWRLSSLGGMWLLLGALLSTACVPAANPGRETLSATADQDEALPVLLLTGFEPFGVGRPPNSSWEGIRHLDGKSWQGYRLVARELPVVWGEPLQYLEHSIAELQPVAIFSFGMGDSFAIEVLAHNERARNKDNAGNLPPMPQIVADGPPTYQATVRADELRSMLAADGYPVALSINAGRYLCEETLYSLEHLKSQGGFAGTVLFSHVLPLGATANGQTVDAVYVQGYVEKLLEHWQTLYGSSTSHSGQQAPGSATSASSTASPSSATSTSGTEARAVTTMQSVSVRPEASAMAAGTTAVAVANADPASPGTQPASSAAGPPSAAGPEPQGPAAAATPADPRQAEVETFVRHYFSSWSTQQMDAYDACFLEESCIQFVDSRGQLSTTLKKRFIAEQRDYHRRNTQRAVEVPESIEIRFEADVARAVVYWKLTAGQRVEYGYDHFTLLRHKGQWKIANLLFYAVPEQRR